MTRRRFIMTALILLLIQLLVNMSLSLSAYIFLAPVCFIIMGLDRGASPIKCMLVAFLTGTAVDLLSSGITGLWSASLTAAVLPRLVVVRRRLWKDDNDLYDMPALWEMGAGIYFIYALFVNTVFYVTYVLLEKMGFALCMTDLIRILLSAVSNSLLMLLFCIFTQTKRRY